jgi:hypothetical protein
MVYQISRGAVTVRRDWAADKRLTPTAQRTIPDDCRIYTPEEQAFLRAVEAWKQANGVKFPLVSEYLAIAVALGYRRVAEPVKLPKAAKARTGGT